MGMGIGFIRVVEDKAVITAVIQNRLRAAGYAFVDHHATA